MNSKVVNDSNISCTNFKESLTSNSPCLMISSQRASILWNSFTRAIERKRHLKSYGLSEKEQQHNIKQSRDWQGKETIAYRNYYSCTFSIWFFLERSYCSSKSEHVIQSLFIHSAKFHHVPPRQHANFQGSFQSIPVIRIQRLSVHRIQGLQSWQAG